MSAKRDYFEVIGGVKNPGRYPYIDGYTALDYIYLEFWMYW